MKLPVPPSAPAGPRMPWLDTMRGVAALMVVWHHLYVVVLHGFPADGALRSAGIVQALMAVGHWGVLGVPVFFVLSGYCVGQAWLRAPGWQGFAWRRIRRIFPNYYASLALVAVCAVAARLISGVNDIAAFPRPTAANILATVFLQTTPASTTPTVCWVYWSLSYEIAFYAVLTAVHALPVRWRIPGLLVAGAAASALAYSPESFLRPGPLFFCDLWPLFAAGVALALRSVRPTAAFTLAAIALGGLPAILLNPLYPGFVASGVLAAGFVLLADRGVPLPRLRWLERAGDFSYSLYLVNVPVILLAGRWLILRPDQTVAGLLGGCVVTVALVIPVAMLFCRWFEKPFLGASSPAARPAHA